MWEGSIEGLAQKIRNFKQTACLSLEKMNPSTLKKSIRV